MCGGIPMLRWLIYLFVIIMNGSFLLAVFDVWTDRTAFWVMVTGAGAVIGTFEALHRRGKLTDVKKGAS